MTIGPDALTSQGGRDAFVASSNSAGTIIQAESFGGPNDEGVDRVVADAQETSSPQATPPVTVDFDPTSGGVFNLTNTGTEAAFIIKLLADKPPLANPDNYTTTAGATLVGSSVLANDSEPAGVNNVPLTAHLIAGPSHAASFTLNADGTFSYTGPPSSAASTASPTSPSIARARPRTRPQ